MDRGYVCYHGTENGDRGIGDGIADCIADSNAHKTSFTTAVNNRRDNGRERGGTGIDQTPKSAPSTGGDAAHTGE